MRLLIAAIGQRMPRWVDEGCAEYAGRFPPHLRLELRELPAAARGKGADLAAAARAEGEQLLRAIPAGARVVALERTGKAVSTMDLATSLRAWMQEGRDSAFLIGGPEGMDDAVLARADLKWSLSALTLPHALARVVLAEQLYRAWSITANLPYHR